MIDYKVLKKYGSDDVALTAFFREGDHDESPELKKVFEDTVVKRLESEKAAGLSLEELDEGKDSLTKKERDEAWAEYIKIHGGKKKAFIKRLKSRLEEGRIKSFQNYRFYYAADLAWDGQPALEEKIPLTLYAQGKLSAEQCVKDIKAANKSTEYVVKDGEGKEHISLGRLTDVAINVVRPLITRRVAAQASKYLPLYPFFKYESRSKTEKGNLISAALSQKVEIISDQFGYRQEFLQVLRRAYLHTSVVSFVESPWQVDHQIRMRGDKEESYITREGVNFVHPHITRVFHDPAYPLASLNHDTGLEYIGFWDVWKKKDFNNPQYFNKDKINQLGDKTYQTITKAKTFFDLYYPSISMNRQVDVATQVAQGNDRKELQGLLSSCKDDQAVIVSIYFEKLIPKDWGIGSYPHPVWVRLLVANDDTVVHAEILPSRPGCVLEYNRDDSRERASSMAHEIMPYQDQADNLFSQLNYLMRLESMLIVALETSRIGGEEAKTIEDWVKNGRYHSEAILVKYKEAVEEELHGTTPGDRRKPLFEFLTSDLRSQIVTTIEGITKVLELLERNQMMSRNELAQFNQRETSANEVMAVATTTNAIHGFLSHGPDEYRAAQKEIIYESLVAKGQGAVDVPVVDSFQDKVIEEAGFKVASEAQDVSIDGQLHQGKFITGSPVALVHDHVFNSRDGTERTVSKEVASSILQFLGAIAGNDTFLGMIGPEQMGKLMAEVFRLLGTTLNLKIDPEGGGFVPPQQVLDQLVQQVQQNSQLLQQLQGAIGAAVAEAKELPPSDTPPDGAALAPA